jgi:hypothetical protein
MIRTWGVRGLYGNRHDKTLPSGLQRSRACVRAATELNRPTQTRRPYWFASSPYQQGIGVQLGRHSPMAVDSTADSYLELLSTWQAPWVRSGFAVARRVAASGAVRRRSGT